MIDEKTVRSIQGKVQRYWDELIQDPDFVKKIEDRRMIEEAMNGRNFTRHSPEIKSLDGTFEYNQGPFQQPASRQPVQVALPLFQ
ncbi:MAG: hypothetical protein AB1791_19030 [Chloroflexota bacterium]